MGQYKCFRCRAVTIDNYNQLQWFIIEWEFVFRAKLPASQIRGFFYQTQFIWSQNKHVWVLDVDWVNRQIEDFQCSINLNRFWVISHNQPIHESNKRVLRHNNKVSELFGRCSQRNLSSASTRLLFCLFPLSPSWTVVWLMGLRQGHDITMAACSAHVAEEVWCKYSTYTGGPGWFAELLGLFFFTAGFDAFKAQ